MLPAVGGDLDEVNALVSRLPFDLQAVRQRGFVHEAQLEEQISSLTARWEKLADKVSDALYRQQTDLVEAANELVDSVNRLHRPGVGRAAVDSAWARTRALQSRVEAAHGSLTEMYDDLGDELEKVEDRIEQVEWMLDQVEAAKFDLLEGEAPLRAVQARWVRQGEDQGPLGILYLTDQRLLYEQKEELTTKKILFVSVKKETVHEFLFDAPVSAVEKIGVGEERSGFLGMGKVEVLELGFDHTAQVSGAEFHLKKGTAEEWQAAIGRVKSGQMDRARTAEAAEEAEALDEARKELPSNCPNCSAPLDQTIVRGMTSTTCKYCGTVIQI